MFFHSDGYVMKLYPEWIEMGVDAVNTQLWCMDAERIARDYAGKITFWGEISRQNTLPYGAPEDVRVYVDVASIEETLTKITERGGAVVTAKTEVSGLGWYAVFTDTEGNEMAIWESLLPS